MFFRKKNNNIEKCLDNINLNLKKIERKLDHSIAMEEQMSEDISTIEKILIKSPLIGAFLLYVSFYRINRMVRVKLV